MKKYFLPLTILAFALTTITEAEDMPKPLALTPAPHPGKEAAHLSFNEISKEGKAQIVFLGDSITAGWNGRGKKIWEKYWAPLEATNFGIGGDRTEHILWRLENGNYDGLNPRLTVLMIGTNNTGHEGREMKEHGGKVYSSTAQETAAGIEAIVEMLRKKQPEMKILLLAIFPRGSDSSDPKRQKNEAVNEMIKSLGDGETVHFLNINDRFLEEDGTLSKEIMPDLLHLSESGYQIWADAISDKVKALVE